MSETQQWKMSFSLWSIFYRFYYYCRSTSIYHFKSREEFIKKKKDTLLHKRSKNYIDVDLISASKTCFDPEKDDFERVKRINQILGELSISKEVYEQRLSISDYHDFQIHVLQTSDSCFANTYFADVSLT